MINPVNIDNGRFRKFGKTYSEGIHVGHDFDCPLGTPVLAIDDGIVIDSREINGFGSLCPSAPGGAIFIQHGNIVALYGHVERLVNKNDAVKKGQIIGKVREFRNAEVFLPHLHFGIWNSPSMPDAPYGYSHEFLKWIDPILFLNNNKE